MNKLSQKKVPTIPSSENHADPLLARKFYLLTEKIVASKSEQTSIKA